MDVATNSRMRIFETVASLEFLRYMAQLLARGLLGLLDIKFVSLRHEGHRYCSAYPVKDVSGVGSRVVNCAAWSCRLNSCERFCLGCRSA